MDSEVREMEAKIEAAERERRTLKESCERLEEEKRSIQS
jgi:hypothetical protein